MGFSALGVFSTIRYTSKRLRTTHINQRPLAEFKENHKPNSSVGNVVDKTAETSDSDSDNIYSVISTRASKAGDSGYSTILDDGNSFQEYKMVLLIRQDLEMSKGKIAAQCCHAVLSSYKFVQMYQSPILARWEACGQPKVTLKVKNEKEMLTLMEKAREAGLCTKSIKDAGKTQIAPGSRTVAAIGPGPISIVDYITGHLKLY